MPDLVKKWREQHPYLSALEDEINADYNSQKYQQEKQNEQYEQQRKEYEQWVEANQYGPYGDERDRATPRGVSNALTPEMEARRQAAAGVNRAPNAYQTYMMQATNAQPRQYQPEESRTDRQLLSDAVRQGILARGTDRMATDLVFGKQGEGPTPSEQMLGISNQGIQNRLYDPTYTTRLSASGQQMEAQRAKADKAQNLYDTVTTQRQAQREFEKYSPLLSNPDFVEKSQGDARIADKGPVSSMSDAERLYKNIFHRNDTYKDNNALSVSPAQYVTDEEAAIFFYLWNTQGPGRGPKAAQAYYNDYVANRASERKAGAVQTQAYNYGQYDPIGASIASVGTNLASGVGLLDIAFQNLTRLAGITSASKPINYNSGFQMPGIATDSLRQGASDYLVQAVTDEIKRINPNVKHPENYAKVASFLYQTGMSMADSSVAIALNLMGIPETLTLANMGAAAGTRAIREARERGATDGQALAFGFSSAIMEALFEKISLDRILEPSYAQTAKAHFLNALKQSFTEGSEEVMTTLANTAMDQLIMGDKSELFTRQRQLMEQGVSEKEALGAAFKQLGTEIAGDLLGGMISGFGMGGAKEVGTGLGIFAQGVRQDMQTARALTDYQNAQQAATQITPQQPPAAPVQQRQLTAREQNPLQFALNKAQNGETVTGNDAKAILNDPQAVQTLRDAGVLADTIRPGAEGRAQIQQAVQALAEQTRAETPETQRVTERTSQLPVQNQQETAQERTTPPLPRQVAQEQQDRVTTPPVPQNTQEAAQEPTLRLRAQEEQAPRQETLRIRDSEVAEPTRQAPLTIRGANATVEENRQEENYGQGQQTETAAAAGEDDFRARAETAAEGARRSYLDRIERSSGLGRVLQDLRNYRIVRGAESRASEVSRIRNQAEAGNQRDISAQDYGIANGSAEQSAKELDSATASKVLGRNWDRAVAELAREGVTLKAMTGQLKKEDGSQVRAFFSGDGKTIVVQIDHPKLSWNQLLDHEDLHRRIKANKNYRKAVEDALLADKNLRAYLPEIIDRYSRAYAEHAPDLTSDDVIEELLADYRAGFDMLDPLGMNPTTARAAKRAAKDIKGVEKERYGSTGRPGKNQYGQPTTYSEDGTKATVDDVAVAANVANEITEDPRPFDYMSAGSASIETYPDWAKNFYQKGGENAQQIIDAVRQFTEAMIASDVIMGYVPVGSVAYNKTGPLRKNIEYVFSFDMDASCPRTFQFLNYRNELQRIAGRPLTYAESIQLIELMRAYGQQIPCSYCYVENKRVLLANNYLNWFGFYDRVVGAETDEEARKLMYGYNEKKDSLSKGAESELARWRKADKDYRPKASEVWLARQTAKNSVFNWLDQRNEAGLLSRKTGKNKIVEAVCKEFKVTDKAAKAEITDFVGNWIYDRDMKIPHNYEIVNDTDISEVDQRALNMHRTAMAYANSASSARTVDNYMPYTDQIWNVTAEQKRRIMAQGGIRKHSSNDFRMDYVQDYFMFFADLAAGGWTGHTYTKNVDYVKIFGRTGDRINVSVAFTDENGQVRENMQEGMGWKDAQQLRKDYAENVGVMAMVTSDAQLSYALNNDWIDMIIPFHASGLDKSVWYNIRMWQDYTSKQNERWYTKDRMEAELKDAGVTVPKDASSQDITELYRKTFNIKMITNKDGLPVKPHFLPGSYEVNGQTVPGHNNDKEKYFQLCKEYGVVPRFQGILVDDGEGNMIDVTEHRNYMKLIKETARTDVEQKPIQFNFDQVDPALGMTPFEYAMQRMQEEARNGGYANTAEDKFGIVKEFQEEYLGKNIPLPTGLDENGKPLPGNLTDLLTDRAIAFREGLMEMQNQAAQEQAQVVEESQQEGKASTEIDDNRYSLEVVDPVQPVSEKWQRGATYDEVKAAHPTLFELAADEAETRNPTQINGTVKTYRKIYDMLKQEGFAGTILDASSGLGYGTRAGRDEYGYDVDDIEPFPDKSYSPKYTDYSKLKKTYDVVISNAVLNVIPQDLRDAMVVKIGEMLNPGGRAFINVRGTDVKNAKSKVAINEDQMEYFIADSGSYQKGFRQAELVDYLKDALGDGFTVTPNSSFGGVSAVVTKNGGSASIEIDPEVAAQFSPEAIALRQSNRAKGVKGERKVSRVRSNTYEYSGLYNEVEAQMDEADEENYTYDPVSEKKSMNEALGRLKADFDGEVSRLSEADRQWGGSDLDTAMGILHRYRTEGRATGDYGDFWRWSKVIQEKGTKGGQFIQAFAKYTRTGTGAAMKGAKDIHDRFKLNPAQQKQVDAAKKKLMDGIDGDMNGAAQDAMKQAKGQKEPGKKQDGKVDKKKLDAEIQRRKDAERLVREISKLFEKQQNHGEPVENWLNLTGEELARKIAGRFSEPKQRAKTTMQTILSDLVGFAEEHALPDRKKAEGTKRTAIDTITDYLNNRDAYGTAWAAAQSYLRAAYTDDQEKLDALNSFLTATIAYNAEGTDRIMLDAILQSADVLGISEKRILELTSAGATASTIDRIGDELVNQVKERMGADYDEGFTQQLKDAVRRHITGIALQESAEEQRLRLGGMTTDAARQLEINLQKLLTQSRGDKNKAAQSVADYLIRELGIPSSDAAIAAERITGAFMDELASRADRRLQQMFEVKTQKDREEHDKLLDLIRLGGLTNSNVEDAVVDALGIGGMSRERQRELVGIMAQFGETLDAMEADDLDGLKDLIRAQAAVRNTPLSRQAEKTLAGETDAEYLREFALAQLDAIAGDFAEMSPGAKISTFQTISHLLNMRTALRNLTSNQVFDLVDSAANNLAMIPDMVIGAFTGKRTVGANKSWLSEMKRAGAKQGAARNALEVRLDVSPDDRQKSKYGTAGRRTNSIAASNAFGRILSHLEEVMGYELNTTDEFHKGSVRGETLESLARFVERGDITQEQANAWAEEEALYRSFQDDTLVGNIMGELKTLLNVIGFGDSGKTNSRGRTIHDFGLGDLVVKYTQVPGALIHRGIEYSPLGYAKMLYDLAIAKDSLLRTQRRGEDVANAQRKLALDIGRATTGSGLITLFAVLAKAGLLRRDDDDKDKNAKAMHAAQGLSGTQLNLTALGRWISGEDAEPQDGDVLADIGFLEPLDSLMTIATLLAKDKDLSISDVGVKSLDGVWKAISNTSAMQTISNIISTVQYHDEANDLPLYFQIPIEIASDSISGFIPSPVRQLAQATDTTYRDQYRSKSLNDQIRAKVMNSIPGVRQMLAPKITPLGEDKKYQKPLLNYLNATLNPGNINVYQASDVVDELNRVYGETDDAKIWPERNAPYSFTMEEEKYTLTPDERTQYQRTRGQQTNAIMEAVMGTDWYKAMGATDQADVLNWIGNFSNYIAKKEMLAGRGVDAASKTYDKYYEALMSGTSPEDVVASAKSKVVAAAEETAAAETIIAEAKIPEASKEEAETMSADAKRLYAAFLQGGVSDSTARNLATSMEGSEASGHEQWRMVYDAAGKEGEKAVTSVMTDDMKRNWNLAKDVGVSMDDYIKVREGFKDLNGNGNKSQDEWNATLDSFTFSTNSAKDKSIKGTLWQILTGSGSTKNNPYDKEAGQKVIDAKNGGGSGSGSYAPVRIPTLRIPEVPKVTKPSSGLRLPATNAAPRQSSGLRLK